MITKDTYRQVQIAILSGVAKRRNNTEIWWEGYGEVTIELLKNKEMIVRKYLEEDGRIIIFRENLYDKNGKIKNLVYKYVDDTTKPKKLYKDRERIYDY